MSAERPGEAATGDATAGHAKGSRGAGGEVGDEAARDHGARRHDAAARSPADGGGGADAAARSAVPAGGGTAGGGADAAARSTIPGGGGAGGADAAARSAVPAGGGTAGGGADAAARSAVPAGGGASAAREVRPGLLARLGLAVVHPRWALAVAADRRHAGRSGSDLIALIAVVVLATQLRGLATAVWLGSAVDPGLGVRAAIRVLTGSLTLDLGLLVVGALGLFVVAGARRSLGRAFDLACVAVLPLVLVELAATVVVRAADATVPVAASWAFTAASWGWMGALLALATRPARIAPTRVPPPPADVIARARPAGGAIALVAAVGLAVQGAWIARNLDLIEPMTAGEPAPAFALPEVDATGGLGAPVALAASRGKITVLDFWATWCKPCLAAMPKLEKLARSHPDVAVIAINLDDPAAARALFNQRGYTIKLLADDGDVSQRYGVSAIPHTVVIDRDGAVHSVIRGTAVDIEAVVDALRADHHH